MGPCNNRKRTTVFKTSPIILAELEIVAGKAVMAQEVASKIVHDRAISKALNTLQRAHP